MAFLSRHTPITILLLVAILIGYGLEARALASGVPEDQVLIDLGANHPELVLQRGEWWRLVASMFLHGGLMHLFLNGWALYQLGGLFEAWLGSTRLLATWFLSGIAGSLASILFTRSLSVGASGAIFGLLGALIAFLVRRRDVLNSGAKSLLGQLVLWAVINVVFGFSVPRIDNAAHLGGFAAGFLLGLILRPRRRLREAASF
ncbi:MAG TPA: rhomboid family intramembrane serine protease [Thermoanaerobaculia bacterium]|nr:rhomboid family intramembrane serine protease [Thermoanaerobaculia bacterium]